MALRSEAFLSPLLIRVQVPTPDKNYAFLIFAAYYLLKILLIASEYLGVLQTDLYWTEYILESACARIGLSQYYLR